MASYLLTLVSDQDGNTADVDIDLGEIDWADPADQIRVAHAVHDALRVVQSKDSDEGDDPDKEELAALAEKHGWTVDDLVALFGIKWDELNPAEKSVAGIIGRAINQGDDPEWIEEMVSKAKNHTPAGPSQEDTL